MIFNSHSWVESKIFILVQILSVVFLASCDVNNQNDLDVLVEAKVDGCDWENVGNCRSYSEYNYKFIQSKMNLQDSQKSARGELESHYDKNSSSVEIRKKFRRLIDLSLIHI